MTKMTLFDENNKFYFTEKTYIKKQNKNTSKSVIFVISVIVIRNKKFEMEIIITLQLYPFK